MRRAVFAMAFLVGAGAAGAAQSQLFYYYAAPPAAPAPPPGGAPSVLTAPLLKAPGYVQVPAPVHPEVRSFYQVKRGGRLGDVARRTGVALSDLLRLNPALGPQTPLPVGTLVGLPVP